MPPDPISREPLQIGVISPARWSLFRLSKQHLAAALAASGHDVVYVDPPVSIGSVLRDRHRWRDLVGPRLESPQEHLRVWRPVVLPGQNTRFGQAANASRMAARLQRLLPQLDLTVAFSLEARGIVGRVPGRRVYYCTDSFEDLPGANAEVVRRREKELIDQVDLVVACSQPLCRQLADRGATPLYLPHATDDAMLAPRSPGPVPPEIAELPRPLAGYVGSLNFRIDAGLLDAARRAVGQGTVVVIGDEYGSRPDPAVMDVLRAGNVRPIGYRQGSELAAYISALDVGLVPYGPQAFNRKSFPLKVLQYLAMGVPVVSSTNGATDELGAAVSIADEPSTFEAAVIAAIADTGDEARTARQRVARERTWSGNASRLVDAVSRLGSR